jgi:YidC/Oxa1 family membrane protein insertase
MTTLLLPVIAFLDQIMGGSLGGAIIALSLAARIALLPLSIHLARRAQRTKAVAERLKPEIDALKKRLEGRPERLFEETMKVYRRNNFSPFDLPALFGSFLQVPVFGLLYGAIRRSLSANRSFLWIRNLSAPNLLLTLTILSITATTAYFMPTASEHARTTMIVIQVIITSFIIWKLAAGLGLYWVSSNLVGLFQALWLRHRSPRSAVPA